MPIVEHKEPEWDDSRLVLIAPYEGEHAVFYQGENLPPPRQPLFIGRHDACVDKAYRHNDAVNKKQDRQNAK